MNPRSSGNIPLLLVLSLPLLVQLGLTTGLLSYVNGVMEVSHSLILWSWLVLLTLTGLLGILVYYWLFRTLQRLNRDCQQIAGGNFVHLRTSPIRELADLSHAFNQIIEQLQDSLQKQADLRESEKKFTKIFHSNPDSIMLTTRAEGCILEVNDSFCKMTGYSANEVLGKTLDELNLWANAAEQFQIVQTLQNTGVVHNGEFEFYTKAGEVRTGLISAEVVNLMGQDCILSMVKDTTELKQAERALRQAEARYHSIFENSVEGIFQSTPDGRYLTVNPSLARIYGYDSPEDLITSIENIGKQVYVQPKRRDEFIAYMRMFDVVSDFESQVFRKDGSTIWISENVRSVRDEAGNLLYFEGTVQDITERRQVEEELRQQRLRAERLLLNILPQTIAERLKRGQLTIASRFEQVTVMFADLVDFTKVAARVPATDLVKLLGQIFSEFDNLVEQHQLEKIKTIGDAYMVVGGLPLPTPDSATAIAEMALKMQQSISHIHADNGEPFQLRIGINSGSIVAGVIGTKKFSYDLWGDTVNVASRMESQGLPGRIQVTEATYALLKDQYLLEERGRIFVKGKGEMVTYWLIGKREV